MEHCRGFHSAQLLLPNFQTCVCMQKFPTRRTGSATAHARVLPPNNQGHVCLAMPSWHTGAAKLTSKSCRSTTLSHCLHHNNTLLLLLSQTNCSLLLQPPRTYWLRDAARYVRVLLLCCCNKRWDVVLYVPAFAEKVGRNNHPAGSCRHTTTCEATAERVFQQQQQEQEGQQG